MSQHTVRLYGYATSPFVVKVGVFLNYKQIPFEFVPVDPVRPKRQLHPFKGQRRVPVLTIDDEWRAESTELGVWLDQVFPERPILGDSAEHSDAILARDKWVNDELLMASFRHAVEWESLPDALHNGWTLSRIIHASTPLPLLLRRGWPFVVKRVGFVRRFGNSVGKNESLAQMRERQCRELVAAIGAGPFLDGGERISLADLSAWSALVTPHLIGIRGRATYLENPDILAWARRVQAHLPNNPLVVPDHLLARALP